MFSRFRVHFIFWITTSLIHAQQPVPRTWTDVNGRSIQATFISADAANVTLTLNGKEHTLPLTRLSAADQAWIKQQSATASSPPAAAPAGLSIQGKTAIPGVKVEFDAEISPELRKRVDKFTQGKDFFEDTDLSQALVAMALPPGFEQSKPHPILFISVTASGRENGKKGNSSIRVMEKYTETALALGWIVMAADGPGYLTAGRPENRAMQMEAALSALEKAIPGSKTWPVVTAGFSGGAKYSGHLGGWLVKNTDHPLIGMFMGGCNQDTATESLKTFQPNRAIFTKVPIYISTGKKDKTASPAMSQEVIQSMKAGGFDHIKEGLHELGHSLQQEHLKEALEWFQAKKKS
jgi:predicted esterase